MRYTLKDYQMEAVGEVLDRLQKARRRWHDDGDKHAFSLSATTGAGKTVMAAAVIEALFFGDDDFDFERDPGSVVLWFSDDPSLNEQSSWRLQEASDKLTVTDLVTIGTTFNQEKLEAGKVYLLNTQKLSKNSLLVRGHDPEDLGVQTEDGRTVMPDARAFTIWDIIRNTIEDPDLTLYLVLDEAHRGMREKASRTHNDRTTIVRQLISGTTSCPGIPVVLGISATVARFNKAMRGSTSHTMMPSVEIHPKTVQESGLLKDTISIQIPDKEGDFETVLLRRATSRLHEITEAWEAYAEDQGHSEPIFPVMVLQVPNTPKPEEIARWLDTIREEWPELPQDCVANVLGEHKTETFGSHRVPYTEPQRVQETTSIRILIAKNAISTGWDCPRAEVLISLRVAKDVTHITQLIGRMVRSPLARRIPGDERLNSVDCILPYFNRASVDTVVRNLRTGGESGEEELGRNVLINPQEMGPNDAIPEAVWEKLLSLPSQSLPKKRPRSVKRLTVLAHELAADELVEDAGKVAHARLHDTLDEARDEHAKELTAARQSILTVIGVTIEKDLDGKTTRESEFEEVSDYAVIEDAYHRAGREFTPSLTMSYAEYLAPDEDDDGEGMLVEAHTIIGAMALVPSIRTALEDVSEIIANEWMERHREAIKALPDDRKEIYRQLRAESREPHVIDLSRPLMRIQMTSKRSESGSDEELPKYPKHLLSDSDGMFSLAVDSTWETNVLDHELTREESIAWYRNPSRASQDSLGISYQEGEEYSILRPDFIFFVQTEDGAIATDLIDPHGTHLADALPKLKGLATYAAEHGEHYRRIEAVAEIDGGAKILDLTNEEVRQAIGVSSSAEALFKTQLARTYPTH